MLPEMLAVSALQMPAAGPRVLRRSWPAGDRNPKWFICAQAEVRCCRFFYRVDES